MITVTLKKSLIGRKAKHIATAHSLGLKKIGSSCKIDENNLSSMGKLSLIYYLINKTSK